VIDGRVNRVEVMFCCFCVDSFSVCRSSEMSHWSVSLRLVCHTLFLRHCYWLFIVVTFMQWRCWSWWWLCW